jgi:hypothetical protein
MAKKDNNTLLLVAGLAIAGYFAYKNGLLSKFLPASGASLIASPSASGANSAAGIALETPSKTDIGVIVPNLDPTGMTLQFF